MRVVGRAVVLDRSDVDTDQIIPARFLKVTDKLGLGDKLFHDWRYEESGAPNPDFVLNQATSVGARVLVSGANFGCGSSREHAPWALKAWGFQAIVAPSFADIFRQNSLKNALVPAAVGAEKYPAIVAAARSGAVIEVDVAYEVVVWPGGQASFPLDPFVKRCLLQGVDELGYLLSFAKEIEAFERASGA
jgi:3-isopropylmalate/(R)-2-methylmalate dehydratase small subunit